MAKQKRGSADSRHSTAKRFSPHRRKAFIEALCRTSNVAASAREAGIYPSAVYRKRRQEPGFAHEWHAALCEGYEHLEMEVLRRLRDGDFQTVDGTKYDFANAQRILTAHRETIGQQRGVDEYEQEDAVLASINARLDSIKEKSQKADRVMHASQTNGAR